MHQKLCILRPFVYDANDPSNSDDTFTHHEDYAPLEFMFCYAKAKKNRMFVFSDLYSSVCDDFTPISLVENANLLVTTEEEVLK